MMNKNEWKKVKLGDITIQIRGVTYKKSDVCEKETENFIPLLRANNIKDSKIIYNDVVFVNQNNVSENQILRKNDILICTSSGSLNLVGKAGQINKNENISFGAFCKVIRILDENRLNPLYLNYFFQSNYYKQNIKKIAQGANINNLKNGDIDNLEIILYSLEKQKYIGNILNDLSNILNKRKEQLFELEKLVKFQFLKMFGDPILNEKNWEIKDLQKLSILKSGGTPSRNNPNYFKGNIPWITTVSLGKLKISEEDAVEFITHEAIENSATKLIPVMSLLFGVRVGVGKSSINLIPLCINQDIIAITGIKSIINIIFLKNLLDLHFNYFNTQKRGATIQGIKSDILKKLSIICPPIELQNKFAEFVKQVDKSKFVIPSEVLGGVA